MITSNANWDAAAASLQGKRLVTLFEISGYSKAFISYDMQQAGQYPWIVSVRPHRQSANLLSGTSQLGNLTVVVQDNSRSLTGDFPFTFEGRECSLKVGFDTIAQGDFVLFFTGVVDRVEADNNNLVYTFVCKEKQRITREVIYQTGDDGEPTGSDHPKTVTENPVQLIRDVWETELGIPTADIDTATLTAYKDDVWAGFQFGFRLTSAPEAKAFLDKEIFKVLGGYAYTKADGKLSVRFLWPLPDTVSSSFSLTEDNVRGVPVPRQAELINVVTHRFDPDDDNEPRFENVEIDAASETKYSMQGRKVADSRGLRSNLQGFALARFASKGFFNYFADKQLLLDVEAFWPAALLEIGDFAQLTHSKIPDRVAGVLGITNKLFYVVARQWDFRNGRVRLKLHDASAVSAAIGAVVRWAVDGTSDYTAATPTQQAERMFVCDDVTRQYSNNDPGHKMV